MNALEHSMQFASRAIKAFKRFEIQSPTGYFARSRLTQRLDIPGAPPGEIRQYLLTPAVLERGKP